MNVTLVIASVSVLMISGLFTSTAILADVAIITNKDNPVIEMNKKQVIDLFMGRYVAFPNGDSALALDQPPENSIRKEFYKRLTGKSTSLINAYWARLIFTGHATPPHSIRHSDEMLRLVRENKFAIGYVDVAEVDDSVNIVMQLD